MFQQRLRLFIITFALVSSLHGCQKIEETTVADVRETPPNFKIAFIGDATTGNNSVAVLNLIKNEDADMVIHAGDLDYVENPQLFEDHINNVFGEDFPYIFSAGNHDAPVWSNVDGYQKRLEDRFKRIGISWSGNLGTLSSFTYKGIFFIATSPNELGVSGQQAGEFIKDQLLQNSLKWRISFWHKNQQLMQIGGKQDEVGWNVYEQSRKGGAIIATGHEHSYCRTYEMSSFQNQVIANTDATIILKNDELATSADEGRSFSFVSGLGGNSVREAQAGLELNPWWASAYYNGNGGQYGALFGVFNYNGDPVMARFYFKDIDGKEIDNFFAKTEVK